jgi:aspartyl-tRNA(Asn)/glutamyl-tRNA(Gln) amidotransferase subunit A
VVITKLTAAEISAKVRGGELAPREIADSFQRRIDAYDAAVGAFLCTNDRDADDAANGPLAGVPVAVKDNICTDWMPTTAGSRIIENYRPPYNATVVDKLIRAGTYVMGKTNLDEFGMGSSTEYSAFFPTKNPRDLTRSPGGSSGGSAAAVCAGFASLALGSDTGGSIRQPAAMCGVVGLKPTYGRVSRYGLIAFAPSFDQIGPLGRTVGDVALLLKVIAGHDPLEATSSRRDVPDYVAGLERDHGRFKIGLIEEFFGDDVDRGIKAGIETALLKAEESGHIVERVAIPSASWALPTYYVVACAETYSNLARYQGVLFGPRADKFDGPADMVAQSRALGFGGEVRRRLAAGAYALSIGYRDQYYAKAQTVRQHMRGQFAAAFDNFDFLAYPVSPFAAFKLNTRNLDPQLMYLADIFTGLANLIGFPALSMPCGFDERGLPVAIHLMSRPWDEERLLALGHRLEHELALPMGPVTPDTKKGRE